jgi:heptosyltransferase-1
VLAGHPALDEVIAIDTRSWRRVRNRADVVRALHAMRALRTRLRMARFDAALDLQGLLKSGVLAALTRAPLRIGFAPPRCRERPSAWFTTRHVTPGPGARHVVEQYLALLEPLGVTSPVLDFRLPSDPAAEARLGELFAAVGLKPRNRVVVLNPGAGRADKRWPVECFRALAGRLIRETGAHVLVVWGPGEGEAAAAIAATGSARPVLAPPTDLMELIAVLRRASIVVAADTGPLHLAAALGTPCVGLYGPTQTERNGPYGAGHRALQAPNGHMASIEVDTVFTTVKALLG